MKSSTRAARWQEASLLNKKGWKGCSTLWWWRKRGGGWTLLSRTRWQNKKKQLLFVPGEVWIGYYGKILHQKGCQALEEAAQGSGGITIPGTDLKMSRCPLGTWFRAGLMVGLDDPGDLFQAKWFHSSIIPGCGCRAASVKDGEGWRSPLRAGGGS